MLVGPFGCEFDAVDLIEETDQFLEFGLAKQVLDPVIGCQFLRGPRACPGQDLILFVIKAAAATQLGELGLSAQQDRLAQDPLPISFPPIETRFTVSQGLR